MKNNTPFFLALSAIKKDKKNYLLSFLIMLIAFTFTITFISFMNIEETVDRKVKEQKYGNWLLCIENLNQENVEYLKINHGEDFVGDMKVISKLHTNHYVGNYDETFFELASIKLMDGRLPSKSHEIISIQGKNSLGDQVSINDHQYQVVGLINEYNQYWEGPSFDYFTYNLPTDRNFVYYSTQESVHQFVEHNNKKVTYNYPLISGEYTISHQSNNNIYYLGLEDIKISNSSTTTILNYFLILIGSALLFSVFYNSKEREKTVFLVRCIGMSKSDMKKYIFYEMIVIAFIALGISIVIGLILSLCVSLFYYNQHHIFVYGASLWMAIQYIGMLMLMIIGITYISLLTMQIHMMDGLIHKVQRKKLKKYNHHKHMNIRSLSWRIYNSHKSLFGIVCILMIVQFLIVGSVTENIIGLMGYIPNESNHYEYKYNFNYYDENMLENIQDEIIEVHNMKYVSDNYQWDVNDCYGSSFIQVTDDFKEYDGLLEEGRLPQNKNECLYFHDTSTSWNTPEVQIGDKVKLIKISDEYETEIIDGEEFIETKKELYDELKIVGIVSNYSVYEEFQTDLNIGIYDIGIITFANQFKKDVISVATSLITQHDVFLEINDSLFNDKNQDDKYLYSFMNGQNISYKQRTMNQVVIMVSMLVISVVFMYFIVNLLLNKINKDMSLIRCLGMTLKQVMQLYLCFGIYIFINYSFFIWILWRPGVSIKYIIIYFIIGINIVILMLLAYRKTEKTLTFYPTDVERYY